LPDDWQSGGFGVYVHWPFCAAKCPYCDFNSHVRSTVDLGRWRHALVAEIEATARTVPDRRVDTVFFGGGTPSLMPPDLVAAVIEAIGTAWTLDPEAEITLEANPTSVEAGRFKGYRDAGVNRVSMGVQALNDPDLRALGRLHTAAEAEQAFAMARNIFPRVSFDLIYARQGQTVAAWRNELRHALAMAIDHLSLYQLTIEPGTRFGDLAARGRLRGLPDSDVALAMFDETQEICDAAGVPAYETSNHARAGAEGRHNLVYWRYGDYAGIGPGAHGRLTRHGRRHATEAARSPEAWLEAVRADGPAWADLGPIDIADQAIELVMMGLRLAEGVDLDRHRNLAAKPLPADRIDELVGLGVLEIANRRLRTTPAGRPVLDAVLRRLLA
jgi:putative oxygen-independent coproporphyrinogen III oxidase